MIYFGIVMELLIEYIMVVKELMNFGMIMMLLMKFMMKWFIRIGMMIKKKFELEWIIISKIII